ncbi:hypothetical protein TKK_0018418 [Trichogramma kaykai]|uniref:phospholipase A1 n=1 Tax=Trichogramma kaykai TaxID=54128 RepID=A0ABD2VXT0_9HYME
MAPSSAALGAASVAVIAILLFTTGNSVQAANLDLLGSFARGGPVRGLTGSLKSAIGKTQEIAGSAVNKTTSAVASEVKSVKQGVSEVADTIGSTVDKTSEAVASTAEEAITSVKEKVDDFKEYVKDGLELNCLGFPKGPLTAALESILSSETKSDEVKFYFSTRRRPDYQAFSIANFTLRGSDFDIRRNTYVITHGFLSHGNEKWLADMKNSILNYENANVIVTDWQKGSNTFNYVSAAASTKIVGEAIASLLLKIKTQSPQGARRGRLHLIGHSLGAHISGRAAFVIKQNEKQDRSRGGAWIANRVTGLDPAQPCFQSKDPELKLTPDDAPYVDIIHTNARTLLFFGLGLSEQLGFTDFYPNGGKAQPGCVDIDTGFWKSLLIPANLIQEAICSHGRSYKYFTESIDNAVNNSCSFVGHRWNRLYENLENLIHPTCSDASCPEMGIHSIKTYPQNEGSYFVPTGDDSPHCHLKDTDKERIVKQITNDDISNLSRLAKELLPKG